jgi:hypothetical protein
VGREPEVIGHRPGVRVTQVPEPGRKNEGQVSRREFPELDCVVVQLSSAERATGIATCASQAAIFSVIAMR